MSRPALPQPSKDVHDVTRLDAVGFAILAKTRLTGNNGKAPWPAPEALLPALLQELALAGWANTAEVLAHGAVPSTAANKHTAKLIAAIRKMGSGGGAAQAARNKGLGRAKQTYWRATNKGGQVVDVLLFPRAGEGGAAGKGGVAPVRAPLALIGGAASNGVLRLAPAKPAARARAPHVPHSAQPHAHRRVWHG